MLPAARAEGRGCLNQLYGPDRPEAEKPQDKSRPRPSWGCARLQQQQTTFSFFCKGHHIKEPDQEKVTGKSGFH